MTTLSTEYYYWIWIRRIGLSSMPAKLWPSLLGFNLCLLCYMLFLYPVVVENNQSTIIVIPHSASNDALKQSLPKICPDAHIRHMSPGELQGTLENKFHIASPPELPGVWELTFSPQIISNPKTQCITDLKSQKHIKHVIAPDHNTSYTHILHLSLSCLITITLIATSLWASQVWRHLESNFLTFASGMFPPSIFTSIQRSYHLRFKLFILACILPSIFMTLLLIIWMCGYA